MLNGGEIVKSKLLKRICVAILTASIALSNMVPVAAESLLDNSGINESLETDANYAEDTSYSLLRGNNLNYGTVSIAKASSIEIEVDGTTQCHHDCEKVYLSLYLERKVDGVYSTYKYWEFVDYNVSSLSREISVIVPSGYYYRVRGYHAAKDGSKEATTTLTSGILVN